MYTNSATTPMENPITDAQDEFPPALFAAILGAILIFAFGFTETSVLHNAAHDARYSAGFPCH
uniref:Cobalt transporter subunit CbtB n=2 Tax=unclassified Candidatus Kentrum TaxID=2643149 RepID=A0A451AXG2_9GAMM|nr:MAG: cobalt transporter subunit CbtB [Candidatus Kentron sp. LPFa]VFK63893.1 MAG: cobalt transporter subunit CbtB [Candidatus Kentron sp. UNK]VFK70738.1 MAG: cobalt transporter subunit CbtB [Candidatus Kentron sp. UNK]